MWQRICKLTKYAKQKSDLVRMMYNFDKALSTIEMWQSTDYNLNKRGCRYAENRAYIDL